MNKSLLEILTLSTDYLRSKSIEPARRMAEEILADALDLQRVALYTNFDRPLTSSEMDRCRERVVRRGKGEPSAYIHGSVEFLGCDLIVTPAVLIPRPETEVWVEKTLVQLPEKAIVWDVCTGSGCIGIALKKHRPDLQVTLSDISSEALAVARQNALHNQVDVNILQGDLLTPFQGLRADVLFCNPPYISSAEYAALDPQVRLFEPKLALESGPTGLEFYQRLATVISGHSQTVYLEIGYSQGEALLKLFPKGTVEKDYAGHDRLFILKEFI